MLPMGLLRHNGPRLLSLKLSCAYIILSYAQQVEEVLSGGKISDAAQKLYILVAKYTFSVEIYLPKISSAEQKMTNMKYGSDTRCSCV